MVQTSLCRTCSETTLLVFPRGGSNYSTRVLIFSDSLVIFSHDVVVRGDTVSVIEGDDLKLSCIYKGNSRATIMWETVHSGTQNNPLTVSNVARTDAGIHYCTLDRSGSTTVMRKVTVKVLYPPTTVVIVPHSIDGDALNLTCSTEANPPASFTWRYDLSYYAPVISEGPVLTIEQPYEKKTVYCTATNTMLPTNGIPVKKVSTVEYKIEGDGDKLPAKQQATGLGEIEYHSNDNIGLVTATALGWVCATVAVGAAVFFYMRVRVLSKRENETNERRSPLNHSGQANSTSRLFASNSQNASERMKMSRSKSSIDCSTEERPKVPDRPPQTLPMDKVPLHSYIELQSPDEPTQHGRARSDPDEIYEHIEDGMPDPRKSYEDINHSDLDVKVEEKTNEGYLVPMQQHGDAVIAEKID